MQASEASDLDNSEYTHTHTNTHTHTFSLSLSLSFVPQTYRANCQDRKHTDYKENPNLVGQLCSRVKPLKIRKTPVTVFVRYEPIRSDLLL